MSYIEQHRPSLEHRHYIITAGTPTHWYNFYDGPLGKHVRKYGSDFCLVINCSRTLDDAYIVPFAAVEGFYSTDYEDKDNKRWSGNVRNDCMDVSLKGRPTKRLNAAQFHNAFHLLQEAPKPLPQKPNCV